MERTPVFEILKSVSDGQFDQIVEYAKNLNPNITSEGVAVMVLDIAFNFIVLDPVIKKELSDMLRELLNVVKAGYMKDLMTDDDFRKNVADYIRRGKGVADFNTNALRQLAYYLSFETMLYGKEE